MGLLSVGVTETSRRIIPVTVASTSKCAIVLAKTSLLGRTRVKAVLV